MRDIPYIFGMMLGFIAVVILGGIWFATDINEDTEVNELNTIVRTTAISHVSLASRVKPGVVYLDQNGLANFNVDKPDFETSVLNILNKNNAIPTGSVIRFDYILTGKPDVIASEYTLNGLKSDKKTADWKSSDLTKSTPKARSLVLDDSVDAIRVRYRKAGHSSNSDDKKSADYWTYQSTVEVDRSDDIKKVMKEEAK